MFQEANEMTRKWLLVGSVALALALALGVGAVVYAQGDTKGGAQPMAELFWDRLANRLGTSPDVVRQAIQGATKDVLAQAVQEGRLTQEQADRASQRVDAWKGNVPFGLPLGGPSAKGKAHLGRVAMTAAAKALGMTPADLIKELQAGKTLRQVAEAKGVPAATVQQAIADAEKAEIDKAAAAGKLTAEQVTQKKAWFDQMAAKLMDHSMVRPAPGNGRQGPGAFGPGRAPVAKALGGMDAAATTLNMTMRELMAERVKGQSLRQIAQAKGIDPAKVEQAIVGAENAKIDAAVAAGKLSQEQATQKKAAVAQMAAKMMDQVLKAPSRNGAPGPNARPFKNLPAPSSS
jgi:hypothetical protein